MLETILTLINAGYTRDEITALLNAESAGNHPAASSPASAEPAGAPVPAPVGGPVAPIPNAVPVAPVAPADSPVDMAGISKAIETMGRNIIAAVQRAQIGGTPAPAPVDPNSQIDAITAQIINPTFRKEGV